MKKKIISIFRSFLFFRRLRFLLAILFIFTIAGCEAKIEDLMETFEGDVVDGSADTEVSSQEKKIAKKEEKIDTVEGGIISSEEIVEIEKSISKEGKLKIGLLLPLSGPDSLLGNALLKSAQMAVCLLYTSDAADE